MEPRTTILSLLSYVSDLLGNCVPPSWSSVQSAPNVPSAPGTALTHVDFLEMIRFPLLRAGLGRVEFKGKLPGSVSEIWQRLR